MEKSLKEKTASGLLWGGISNGIQQLLNFVFGIVLARVLSQSDYGMVGMLLIFSQIAYTLYEGGFISALNKRKNITDNDYNSVFWFSSLAGILFYLILFFAAPLIAKFYHEPKLIPLARYMFLSIVLSCFGIAPRAYLFRNLMVKENAIISITSLLISGLIAICMALNGFSYWGIATQTLIYVLIITSMNFYYAKWKPDFHIDFTPIKEMFGFGSKLIVTNIFNIINNNIFSVLLGRYYTVKDVGNYTEANKWNSMGHSLISNMLTGVVQPIFTKVDENDNERVVRTFRKMMRFTAFVSFPAMFGLSLISKDFIVIAITEKWLESACMLQILCIWGAFVPLNNLMTNFIISRGKSNIYMWNVVVLSVLGLCAVYLAHPLGLYWMIYIFVAINIFWFFVWHHFVKREIGIKLLYVLKDIAPYFLLSAGLIVGTHFVVCGVENIYLRVACKIVIVSVAYIAILKVCGSVILKETIEYLVTRKWGH